MSVASIIGAKGVEKKLIEHWDTDELMIFKKSSEKLEENLRIAEDE